MNKDEFIRHAESVLRDTRRTPHQCDGCAFVDAAKGDAPLPPDWHRSIDGREFCPRCYSKRLSELVAKHGYARTAV